MMQVLIVDDELSIRTLLGEILEDDGCYVTTAENAEQAREYVRHKNFDLILLDIWMPGTDGITLLKEWQSNRTVSCPVVIMSGHGAIETAMEAIRLGACDFLEKPISQSKLLGTCHRLLREWSQRKSLIEAQQGGENTLNKLANTPHSEMVEIPSYVFGSDEPFPVIELPLLGLHIDINQNYRVARDNFERAYFSRILLMKNGSVSELSQHSGLERTHLYRKLRALGLDPNHFKHRNIKNTGAPVYGPGEELAEPYPMTPERLIMKKKN